MMFWSSSSLLNLDDEEVESRNVLRYSVDRVILYFQSNIFLPWHVVKWRFFFLDLDWNKLDVKFGRISTSKTKKYLKTKYFKTKSCVKVKDLPPKFLPQALDFQKNMFAVLNGKVLLQISRTSTSIFFVMCKQHSTTVLYVKMAGRLKKLQCNIFIRMYICSPYNAFTLDIIHPSFCSR